MVTMALDDSPAAVFFLCSAGAHRHRLPNDLVLWCAAKWARALAALVRELGRFFTASRGGLAPFDDAPSTRSPTSCDRLTTAFPAARRRPFRLVAIAASNACRCSPWRTGDHGAPHLRFPRMPRRCHNRHPAAAAGSWSRRRWLSACTLSRDDRSSVSQAGLASPRRGFTRPVRVRATSSSSRSPSAQHRVGGSGPARNERPSPLAT